MEASSFLPIAAPNHPADLLAKLLEGFMHSLTVLPSWDLIVSASQFTGQLESFFGGHLPGSQEVSFVRHQKQGDVSIRVNLADVLVQGTDDSVALIVCDGVNKNEAICPVDWTVYLLLAAYAVSVILPSKPRGVRLENWEQGADRANSHTALLATRSFVLMCGCSSAYRQKPLWLPGNVQGTGEISTVSVTHYR